MCALNLSRLTKQKMKIVVFGGSGYVGQQIVKAAFAQGVRVTSISRTGAPPALDPSLEGVDDTAVRWKRADIFNESQWVGELAEADAVISCLGAFGSNQVTIFSCCRVTLTLD